MVGTDEVVLAITSRDRAERKRAVRDAVESELGRAEVLGLLTSSQLPPEVRRSVAEALPSAAAERPDLVDELAGAVLDVLHDSDVSSAAALALVAIDADRARDALIRPVSADTADKVRQGIAVGVREMIRVARSPLVSAVPVLARLVDLGGSGVEPALAALGGMDDEGAWDALVASVPIGAESGDQRWRSIGVRALLASPTATRHRAELGALLLEIARSGSRAAGAAMRGLATLPGGIVELRLLLADTAPSTHVVRAVGILRDRQSISRLIELLAVGQLRDVAVAALVEIEGQDAVSALVALVPTSGSPLADAEALGAYELRGVAALLRHIDDPRAGVRGAVQTLARGSGREAVMAAAGKFADADTRVAALRCLGLFRVPDDIEVAASALSAESPAVRLAAVEALTRLNSFALAMRVFNDPEPEVRVAVAVAARSAEVVPQELLELVGDVDPRVRAAAITTLARSSDPRAQVVIAAALDDPDPQVLAAAALLIRPGQAEAVPTLVALFGHPRVGVRRAAARSVAAADIEAVRAAARNSDPVVRATAAMAAGLESALQDVVHALLADPVTDVRIAALRALRGPSTGVRARVRESLLGGALPEASAAAAALARAPDVEAAIELGRAVGSRVQVVARAAIRAVRDRAEAYRAARWSEMPDGRHPPFVTGEQASVLRDALVSVMRSGGEVGIEAAQAFNAVAELSDAVGPAARASLDSFWYEPWRPDRDEEEVYGASRLDRHVAEGPVIDADPRHLDATFYRDTALTNRLLDGVGLHAGCDYVLEVAVRSVPTGIPTVGVRQSIRALPRDQGVVPIDVSVEAGPGLVVEEPVGRLMLGPDGDSQTTALFRVRAEAETHSDADDRAELRIRLFHAMNLLESAIVRAEIVSRFRPTERSQLGLNRPIELEYDRMERGYTGLSAEPPRALHIDVERRDDAYRLVFTWDGDGEGVTFASTSPISPVEIGQRVADIRQAFFDLATRTGFAVAADAEPDEQGVAMCRIATLGRDLHTALFKRRRGSAAAHIGDRLQRLRLPDGATVQVSVHPDASEFLFPWPLLFDGQLPEQGGQLTAVNGFWGARYRIEQLLPGRPIRAPRTGSRGRRASLLLWKSFDAGGEHTAALAREGASHIEVTTPPITAASVAREAMEAPVQPDVFYFLAHAHTRQSGAEILALLDAALMDAPIDTAHRGGLDALRSRIAAAVRDPSWIKLTNGRLVLDDLYAGDADFPGGPLVVLNACESAQLTPTLTGASFVDFFLDRGASSVLGTECTMTTAFARPFAEFVFKALAGDAPIGTALLAARRHFLERGNPLGLAYTLYGSADFALAARTPTTLRSDEAS